MRHGPPVWRTRADGRFGVEPSHSG